MSPDLREEVSLELAQLGQLLAQFENVIAGTRAKPPDAVTTLAIGAFLHSFYTGIENLFRRIAIHLDDGLLRGQASHIQLLRSMAQETAHRPRVITPDLLKRLQNYLNFRHVFRQAYSFELQWGKMAPLVFDCRATLDELEAELELFLHKGGF